MASDIVAIRITGLDAVERHLTHLAEMRNVNRAIRESTALVEHTAKSLARVDTGQMKGSIHGFVREERNAIVGIVYCGAEHGIYNEFGTGRAGQSSNHPKAGELGITHDPDWSGMTAQPFMYPGLNRNRGRITRAINDAIKEDMR